MKNFNRHCIFTVAVFGGGFVTRDRRLVGDQLKRLEKHFPPPFCRVLQSIGISTTFIAISFLHALVGALILAQDSQISQSTLNRNHAVRIWRCCGIYNEQPYYLIAWGTSDIVLSKMNAMAEHCCYRTKSIRERSLRYKL